MMSLAQGDKINGSRTLSRSLAILLETHEWTDHIPHCVNRDSCTAVYCAHVWPSCCTSALDQQLLANMRV